MQQLLPAVWVLAAYPAAATSRWMKKTRSSTLAGKTFHEGDYISIDGSTGNIYDGIIPTVDATIAGEFGRIMGWADKYRKLRGQNQRRYSARR